MSTENAAKDNRKLHDEESAGSDMKVEDDVQVWEASKQVKMIVACLAAVSLVVALDATILVPALPTIARSLNGTASETFWAGTSYLLTSATFQPLLGALSDVSGRREVLLLSVLLFTVGTLIACLAQNFTVLLAGRAVQGIGGGGIITLNLIIFTDLIPLRQRPKYFGISQLSWAVGTIAGPLVGGAIAQGATWRLLFYINFPFCAIGLVIIPWIVRIKLVERLTFRNTVQRVDWIGGGLFIAGTTSFLIGLTWGGHSYPWNSYQTLVPLLLGVAVLGITGIWEWRYAALPFIRRSMIRSRKLGTIYFCTALQGRLLYAQLYYLGLYFLGVKGRSPVFTGVSFLASGFAMLPASALAGVLVSKLGTWQWAVWLGWAVNTLASGLLILLDENTPTVGWVFMLLLFGLGQGLILSAHSFAVQAIVDTDDVAYATSFFAFMRSSGLCLGVAIGGTIFQNRLQVTLQDAGLPVSIAADAEAFIWELATIPVDSPLRISAVSAYAQALRFLFEVLVGISGGAFLLSLTVTGHYSLDKALKSLHAIENAPPSQDSEE